MRTLSASLAALLLLPCANSATAQDPVREGLWEISVQGQVGGQPISSTPLVVRQCIDKESAQDLMAKLAGGAGGCQISDFSREGAHARWSLNCTGQIDVSGTGEVTMRSDGFNGTLDLVVGMGGQSLPMLQAFDARWVGPCK